MSAVRSAPGTNGTSRSIALPLVRGTLRVLTSVSPGLASRVAVELFRTPRRFRRPPREEKHLQTGEPLDILLGVDTRIRAWRWGSGPLILLAHGWEGRGSQMGEFVRPLVEAGFSAVTFDAPGHGQSSGSRSSLPHFAWALRGVADAVGEPHAVIAHSLGCAATALAVRDGLPARRLVFVAPPLDPLEYTRQFGAMLGLDDVVIDGLRRRIEERFLRQWHTYSLAAAAPNMRVPLLVVHDRDDEETLWQGGAQLAALWPEARLITTEGLGHRRVLRDPQVVGAVAQFATARPNHQRGSAREGGMTE